MRAGIVTLALTLFAVGCVEAAPTDPDVKPDAPVVGTPKDGYFSYEISRFCHNNFSVNSGPALKDYVEWDGAIFTGKVVERRLTFPEKHAGAFNGCWVKFRVEDIIKGSLGNEIWVKAVYRDRGIPEEEIYTYKHCYLESGKRYLVTGQYIPPEESGETSLSDAKEAEWFEFVMVYKDTARDPIFRCSPVREESYDTSIIKDNIKIIMQQKQEIGQ